MAAGIRRSRASRGGAAPGPGRGRNSVGSQRRSPSTRRTSRAIGSSAEAGAAKHRLTGRAAVLALLLAALVVSYASSLRAWLEQHREISGLQSQIAATKDSVAQMRQEKARWHDPAYIEAQARERFAWVLPGEIGFTVIDGHPGDNDQLDLANSPSVGQDWWQRTWGSVLAAAAEPKPKAGTQETPTRKPARRIGPNGGSGSPAVSGGPGG
jgi:cell division protein FtsB